MAGYSKTADTRLHIYFMLFSPCIQTLQLQTFTYLSLARINAFLEHQTQELGQPASRNIPGEQPQHLSLHTLEPLLGHVVSMMHDAFTIVGHIIIR